MAKKKGPQGHGTKKYYSLTGDLSVTQAAAELGVCEKTLREKFIWTGLLPARKQGRAYRISRADLDAFRAKGKLAWEIERRRLLGDNDLA